MEVKILCPCGAKYKFDVEPLNGKLPGAVQCPVCNADGTALGDEIIARALAQSAPAVPATPAGTGAVRISIPAAQVPQSSRSGFVAPVVPKSSKELKAAGSAEAPVASPPVAPPAQALPVAQPAAPAPAARAVAPTTGSPRLSVQAGHAPAAAETPTVSPPLPSPAAAPRASAAVVAEPSFTRGMIGIAAASFVGLLIWFAITLFFGPKFKWAAIGIGALIGWTGHWLAKEKSQRLGITAAIATALVMIIGVLWSARHEAYQAVNETIEEMWQEEMAYAREAVKASGTDAQLKAFLDQNGFGPSEDFEDDEEDGSPLLRVVAAAQGADAKQIGDFRKNELPKLRKLAEGKVSRSQFDRENRPALEMIYTAGFIFVSAFRIKMLVLIGLAIGASWKFTAG